MQPSSALAVPWAYIKVPALQLEHWQRQDNLHDHCLVVACEKQRTVLQANSLAGQLGVKPGMDLADAWLMSEGLLHQFYDPQHEAELLKALAGRLYSYFADIAIDQHHHGLWVQLKSLKRLFADIEEVASVVAAQFRDDCGELNYTLTFASNPCLAQLGIDDHRQNFTEAIKDYPILQTFLAPGIQQKLVSMGLNTLGKLNQIPSPVLGKKLGKEVVLFLAELRGEVCRSFNFYQPEVVFYQSRQLNAEVHTWSSLRFACKSLLQALEQSLNANQQSTQRLVLWLFGRDFKGNPEALPSLQTLGVESVQVELARPAWKADDFFSILQLKMDTARFSQPIVDIAVQVTVTEPRAVEHGSLYAAQQQRTDLDLLLNRLQARLGQQRVYGLECTSSWLPEQQQKTVTVGKPVSGHPAHVSSWRPPWLVSPEPTNIDWWVISRQPQRLSLPWWYQAEPLLAHRDYVLAQHMDGRWGWIFFQPSTDTDDTAQGWYLQGWAS
ncbi:MAG: DNA polymerase Y family protein [Idiomarina sp.]|nr:DNA polymerase Y family protein [Idiomarina sp.]